MLPLRTVLCSVDSSTATARQVGLAVDLCRAFGARLVLHHNLVTAPVGASVGWMWAAEHPTDSQAVVEQELGEILARLSGLVQAEARVTHGQPSAAVLSVAEAVGADLVILSTHGATDEDHISVTEQVLERAKRAVIALHEPDAESRAPSFAAAVGQAQVVVVPTDLRPESRAAVELAFELARVLPIELHLLHLLPRGATETDDRGTAGETRRRLIALIPDDLVRRTHVHVEGGNAARGITEVASRLQAACIVMGGHTRAPLRRWFSRDTSRAVLHRAPCSVWYVPGQRSA